MFVCQSCGIVVGPHVRPNRVVTEVETVSHPFRSKVFKFSRYDPLTRSKRTEWIDDPGGSGTQIVREVSVCNACAPNLKVTNRDERGVTG